MENHLPPRSQTVQRVFMSAIHIRNLRRATEAAVSLLMSWAHVCTFFIMYIFYFISFFPLRKLLFSFEIRGPGAESGSDVEAKT